MGRGEPVRTRTTTNSGPAQPFSPGQPRSLYAGIAYH